MPEIYSFDAKIRCQLDNPWWETGAIPDRHRMLSPRPFLYELQELVQSGKKLPVLLAGPRGAGKTVLLMHLVQELLSKGVPAKRIIHLSLDVPAFANRNLKDMVAGAVAASNSGSEGGYFIVLDGVHGIADWEKEVAALSTINSQWRIIASSNIAPIFLGKKTGASLRDSEKASGDTFAGIILPPITFAEFIQFQNLRGKIFDAYGKLHNTDMLNAAFVDYIEWGGFTETVMGSSKSRIDTAGIVTNTVLQPTAGMYGIGDVGELSRIYAHLAQATASGFSMEGLAKEFSIAKNTIRKYLDYLEAAYLIRRVWRVDGNGKKFSRQTKFKVYLINPSHRAALFGTTAVGDDVTARLAETAVISQFVHTKSISRLFYAEWKNGQSKHHVSLVEMPATGKRPVKCIEIDWSDRAVALPQKVLSDMTQFMETTKPDTPSTVLTRTIPGKRFVGDHEIGFLPVAVWCWAIGKPLADKTDKAHKGT